MNYAFVCLFPEELSKSAELGKVIDSARKFRKEVLISDASVTAFSCSSGFLMEGHLRNSSPMRRRASVATSNLALTSLCIVGVNDPGVPFLTKVGVV